MLRQLARLTRPVAAAGPRALAVAVYAGPDDSPIPARESGMEGVACVDDVARVLDVVCRVWAETKLDWVHRWAQGLLEFVLWMQEDDGRWLNFIYDWDGERNRHGITSMGGENFWHARALVAMSRVKLVLGDERAATALLKGMEHAVRLPAAADVRALHMEVARRLILDGDTGLKPALRMWADEIASTHNSEGVLMNSPDETGTPHLWGHIQEGALARAGALLGDDALVATAEQSATALLEPTVRTMFDMPAVTPYDVASVVQSLEGLAHVTGEARWSALAADARAWFDGRNPAKVAVYDRATGRVADGLDDGRPSGNSGAEANVVAAEVLFDDAVATALKMEVPDWAEA